MPETERVKPRSMYVEEAIQHAIASRWSEALAVNRTLLERYGADDDTYNRLGKALTELGRAADALDAYTRALELSPLNGIAQKNVRKLSALLQSREEIGGPAPSIDVDLFTEEPGKSALTVLIPPQFGVSVAVAPGESVDLEVTDGQIHGRSARGILLGELDAKIARRLTPLIATGNRYAAAVARVADDRIEVVVRETFQSPENSRKSSFPISRAARREEFRPYAKDTLLASRGIDDQASGFEEETSLAGAADDRDEDLAGMEPVEVDLDGDGIDETDDEAEADEDIRAEDEY